MPLDEARAARAVAAGQGERLRERIAAGAIGSEPRCRTWPLGIASSPGSSRDRSGRFVAFLLDFTVAVVHGAINKLRRR